MELSTCMSNICRTGPDPLPTEINRHLASPSTGTRIFASKEKGNRLGSFYGLLKEKVLKRKKKIKKKEKAQIGENK